MNNGNQKKHDQLDMKYGTASNRLRKSLMFKYVQLAGDDFCFQCGTQILLIKDLSVEHKTPWLDSEDPSRLFFDLDNVAFSHLSCNIKAARRDKYTDEERREAVNLRNRQYYTAERRKERYERTGH